LKHLSRLEGQERTIAFTRFTPWLDDAMFEEALALARKDKYPLMEIASLMRGQGPERRERLMREVREGLRAKPGDLHFVISDLDDEALPWAWELALSLPNPHERLNALESLLSRHTSQRESKFREKAIGEMFRFLEEQSPSLTTWPSAAITLASTTVGDPPAALLKHLSLEGLASAIAALREPGEGETKALKVFEWLKYANIILVLEHLAPRLGAAALAPVLAELDAQPEP